jgi:hypothetical protein
MMDGNVVIPRRADVMLQAVAVEQSGRLKIPSVTRIQFRMASDLNIQ